MNISQRALLGYLTVVSDAPQGQQYLAFGNHVEQANTDNEKSGSNRSQDQIIIAAVRALLSCLTPVAIKTYVDKEDISKNTNILNASPVIVTPNNPVKHNKYEV